MENSEPYKNLKQSGDRRKKLTWPRSRVGKAQPYLGNLEDSLGSGRFGASNW